MGYKCLLLEKHNNITVIYINQPPVNSVNRDLLNDLDRVFDDLRKDDELAVVILTGKGDFFIGGANLPDLQMFDHLEAQDAARQGQIITGKMEAFPHPIIAAIHGPAMGGGAEIAWACDIRIASSQAIFAQPEVSLGFNLGWGGSQRLPYLIGRGRAMEFMLTTKPINSAKALEWGLVNQVVEPEHLMEEALKMAEKIASHSQQAVTFTKKATVDGYKTGGNSMVLESELWGLSFVSGEPRQRISAFLNKLMRKKSN